MIATNVAINDTRDHWSIIVDLHLAFIESVTTSNSEFADKKKRHLFPSTLPYSYIRNLTRRPEARDAVVKSTFGIIDVIVDRSDAWVILGGIYLSTRRPVCLSFRAAHVMCVRYMPCTIAEEERRIRRQIGRCMRKKNQSLSGKMISNGRESRNRMLMYP